VIREAWAVRTISHADAICRATFVFASTEAPASRSGVMSIIGIAEAHVDCARVKPCERSRTETAALVFEYNEQKHTSKAGQHSVQESHFSDGFAAWIRAQLLSHRSIDGVILALSIVIIFPRECVNPRSKASRGSRVIGIWCCACRDWPLERAMTTNAILQFPNRV
jgi:hypothetical protein